MKSEKIIVKNREYYVSSESLENPEIQKLFLFEDPGLQIISKDISGMTKMVYKSELEDTLKEGIGGAGYAVWGGGGGGYGNPSMGGRVYGRGFGFGQSSSNNGGPNLMYTYSIKPLDPILQQPATPQNNDKYIHPGSEIKGKVLGKDKEVHGKIVGIKDDTDGNILHYIVQEFDTALKFHVDPTSIKLVTHEERPDSALADFAGTVGEEFYPRFSNFLNEGNRDARESCKRSKLPKDIKEKVLKMGLSKFENGRAYGLGKPKIEGKSFYGVSMGADKNGFFVYTHRARSKSYKSPEKIPNKDIEFIESTG